MKTHMLAPDTKKSLCGRRIQSLCSMDIETVDCHQCLHIHSDLSVVMIRIENYMRFVIESHGKCRPEDLLPYIYKELLTFRR